MNPNQRNVEEVPTVELKATAFDLTKQLQFAQNQLSIIEQELMRRAQESQNAGHHPPFPTAQLFELPTPPNGLPTK